MKHPGFVSVATSLRLLALLILACPALLRAEEPSGGLFQQARGYRQKGYEAQQLGSLEVAISYYQKAILLDPSYATPYNDLGVAYEAIKQPEQAQQAYLKCLEANPHYLSAYSNLAMLYEAQGDVQRAASYWTQRVHLGSPDDPGTQNARQHLDRLMNQTSAGAVAQQHEQTPPPGAQLPSLQGQVQASASSASQPPSSREQADAVSVSRQSTPLPSARRKTQEELARLRETNKALEAQVINLTQANSQLENKLKDLSRLQQQQEALELTKLRKAHMTLQEEMGRLAEANTGLKAMVEHLTKTTQTAEQLKQEHQAAQTKLQEEHQRLQQDRETAVQEIASLRQANEKLLQTMMSLRQTQEELQARVTTLTQANASLEAKVKDLPRFQEEQEALQRKIDSLTTEAKQAQAKLYYDLGIAYTELKAYPQAIEAYEKSLVLNPDNPKAHSYLGLLYKHVHNDPEKAGQHLRRYLQMSPHATDREQFEALLGLMKREEPSR